MPKGVPNAGFRVTRKSGRMREFMSSTGIMNSPLHVAPISHETDEEIEDKLSDRFDTLEMMTASAIEGDIRSLIVSGPAGLGKSYTVEETLSLWDAKGARHSVVKGFMTAPALYKMLYQHREKGMTLVIDDCDKVFFDDKSMSLLKSALDTTKNRIISYMTEGILIDEETAARLPKQFQFDGTVIFITNYDFDEAIENEHRLAVHFQALVSRSHYIDMAMKSRRDYMIQIQRVARRGLLKNSGLDEHGKKDVMNFIKKHQDVLREVTLRMAIKIADIRRSNPEKWEKICRVTCCKNS
jgi:hypothetical protein